MPSPVADTGPLISYARADRLDLLRAVIPELILPPEVFAEATRSGPGGSARPGAEEIRRSKDSWVLVQAVTDSVMLDQVDPDLDEGERHAIALALELGRDLLIDERTGRREASRLGIPLISSLAILRLARRDGLIPLAKPELDRLISAGFRLHARLYEAFLTDLGETP